MRRETEREIFTYQVTKVEITFTHSLTLMLHSRFIHSGEEGRERHKERKIERAKVREREIENDRDRKLMVLLSTLR